MAQSLFNFLISTFSLLFFPLGTLKTFILDSLSTVIEMMVFFFFQFFLTSISIGIVFHRYTFNVFFSSLSKLLWSSCSDFLKKKFSYYITWMMKVPFYCFYNFNSSFYLFSSVSSNAWTYWSCYNKTFKFLSSSVSFFILFITPDILLQHIFRFYSYLVIFFIRCLTLCRHIVDCLEHIAFQCCALV